MNKAGKTKVGAGVAKARAGTGKTTTNRQSAETKLAELKRRLLEISDLAAAGAVLRWDQFTYMPRGGAPARARQRATLSRLAHENRAPVIGEQVSWVQAPHDHMVIFEGPPYRVFARRSRAGCLRSCTHLRHPF